MGDRWLLCSDGLRGIVSDEEIARMLSQSGLEETAEALLRLALSRGAPDNVTLIVAEDETGR